MGGDLHIVDEVCRNRGLQQELAANAPEHPLRIFGQVVEGSAGEQQLTRLMSGVVERVLDSMKTYIDERLTVFENRQRRGGPYALADGNDARLSIPKFLLEKERSDPQFASIKAAFTPSFSVVAHVLLKRSPSMDRDSRHSGLHGLNLANAKQKFAYTEKERYIFDEAWELTNGLRESLLPRPEGDAVVRPSVLQMLLKDIVTTESVDSVDSVK